jgi:stage II sporulation protein D (peptidoglycan lytic transglycosylase)
MAHITNDRNAIILSKAWAISGILSLTLVMSFAVLACQQFLNTPRTQQTNSYEPDIKVRLERNLTRADLGGTGYIRVSATNSTPPLLLKLPLTIRLAEDAVVLESVDGTIRRFPSDPSSRKVCVLTPSDSSAVSLGEFHSHWPLEVFVLTRKGKRSMDIVERLPLESYLPGVLSKELYPSWSAVTFRAQAIAARSYALHEMQRREHNGSHFHVERTTQDQAYVGKTDQKIAHRAVEDTRGVVLTYNNHFLRAYYSSTCGGRAGSARHTWPTTVGYGFNLDAPLQAVKRRCPDEASPRYRWTRDRNAQQYTIRLASYAKTQGLRLKQIKSLANIEPSRWNVAGRPASYSITDEQGRVYSLTAEQLRLASNFNQNDSLPTITQKTRVLSGDLEITLDGSSIHFAGRGFGHGVGMCQFGAQGLSLEGYTPTQILQHYYPGAAIERAY